MKRIKNILVFLTVALLTVTCKKEHIPANTTSTPVFYFNGLVGGVSTVIDAGINNYYMYSSYKQDTNHVYNFIGNLQKTTNNLSSIQIQINDYKVSALNSNTQPDSSFKTGTYSYYTVSVTDTVYNVQFSSSYINGTPQTYTWTFGDGTTSNSANPLHTYSSKGSYYVCLTINGSSGTSNICNRVNLSSPSNLAQKVIVTSLSSGNTIYFYASTSGFTPHEYNWNFEDGSPIDTVTSSVSTYSVSHTYTNSALYNIYLTVVDTSGDTISTHYNAPTASYTAGAANYTVTSITSAINTGSSLRLSNVFIKWTDAFGVVYTTNNNALQPSSSYFKIISVAPYQNNINGQATEMLHVNFTCTLYSNTGTSIQITNADAVIAVAYK